jgi:hypothetical protein
VGHLHKKVILKVLTTQARNFKRIYSIDELLEIPYPVDLIYIFLQPNIHFAETEQ